MNRSHRHNAALESAHHHCSRHRQEVLGSEVCGCFYCCQTFPPSEIEDWVDEIDDGIGTTALCPRCAIDAVIGSASGIAVTPEFLKEMRKRWFS